MKLAKVFVLFVMVMALPCDTFTATLPPHGNWVEHIVYASDRLWLLDDAKSLFSLSEGEINARPESATGKVFGLCVSQGYATVISKPTAKSDYVVRQYRNKSWETLGELTAGTHEILSMVCDGEKIVAIVRYVSKDIPQQQNEQFLIEFKDGAGEMLSLYGRLREGDSTALIHGTYLYVGLNAGEWGGGLQRINLTTSLVESIDNLDSDNGCGGPLYAGCDPVTAISDLPGHPDCVSVAIGLRHMGLGKGRLLSVCDHKVERLYELPIIELPLNPGEHSITQYMPFYGLTQVGSNLYATGTDGLYQRDAKTGETRRLGMPAFRRYGPFTVSFTTSGLVLVMGYLGGDYPVGSIPILLTTRP